MTLTVQEITNQLNRLLSFLEPVHSLANSHFVSFFAESVWSKHVPFEIQSELNNLNSVVYFIQLYPEIIKNKCPSEFVEDHPNLLKFIKTAMSISVTNDERFFKLLQELECFLLTKGFFKKFKLKEEDFMSQKKLHEVEITSKMAASISELTQSSHVVDVGGGKGYLSCILALYYSFKVLGLDSSEVTTCGAVKRSEKVAKLWNCEINCTRDSEPQEEIFNKKAKERFIRKQYKQATTFVKPDTDIESLLSEGFNEDVAGVTLTGLHTCGDLSPTSLRMFVSCKKVKGLINVGCCYNHISEEFSEHNLKESIIKETEYYGFPMSNFLRKKNCRLGQNARMLAAHSLHRINLNSEFEFSQTSIFYRAVLEVFKKDVESSVSQGQVGKLARKCNNFHEYMRTALRRLGIPAELTEDDLDKLYESYADKKPHLTAFYFLRITLAPVVESIILLDRVLYLLENGMHRAFLVPLFNLEISPRGFGIIAWKETDERLNLRTKPLEPAASDRTMATQPVATTNPRTSQASIFCGTPMNLSKTLQVQDQIIEQLRADQAALREALEVERTALRDCRLTSDRELKALQREKIQMNKINKQQEVKLEELEKELANARDALAFEQKNLKTLEKEHLCTVKELKLKMSKDFDKINKQDMLIDQLRSEVEDLKEALNSERNATNLLIREHNAEVKMLREEVKSKSTEAYRELKERATREREEYREMQEEAEKTYRVLEKDFRDALAEKDEELRKVRAEAKLVQKELEDQLRSSLKEPNPVQVPATLGNGDFVEMAKFRRLKNEMAVLKEQNRKLLNEIQILTEEGRINELSGTENSALPYDLPPRSSEDRNFMDRTKKSLTSFREKCSDVVISRMPSDYSINKTLSKRHTKSSLSMRRDEGCKPYAKTKTEERYEELKKTMMILRKALQ